MDDALSFLISELQKTPSIANGTLLDETTDLYQVTSAYLRQAGKPCETQDVYSLSPQFLDAAWHLCRLGVLRPGAHRIGASVSGYNYVITHYTITPYGLEWLRHHEMSTMAVPEPTRFSAMCRQFAQRLGEGFFGRAQEANRCHEAHAYLACCAMCGAAAEAIVLELYMAKKRVSLDDAMREYQTGSGRGRIQRELMNGTDAHIQREFPKFLDLLKYWRDQAAHGGPSDISEI